MGEINLPGDAVELSDQELLRQAHDGSIDALLRLLDRHSVFLYGVCYAYARDHMDAQDVFQDAAYSFIVWVNQKVPLRGPLRGLLRSIAMRKAVDLIRHKQSYRRITERLSEQLRDEFYESIPEGDRRSIIEVLKACLEALPDRQRRIITLRYIECVTWRVIAEELARSIATVREQAEKGLKALKSCILANNYHTDRYDY